MIAMKQFKNKPQPGSREGRKEIIDFLLSIGFVTKTNFDSLVILEKTPANGFSIKATLSRSALESRTAITVGEDIIQATSSLPWEEANTLLPTQAMMRLLNSSRADAFARLRKRVENKQN